MKKMMTVLAACAVTSLALADSGVVSQNIVGYNTVTITNGYNLFAYNWNQIGSTDPISVQNLVDKNILVGKARIGQSPDSLLMWNRTSGSYTTLWLYVNASDPTKSGNWVTGTQPNDVIVSAVTIGNGDSFWINSTSPTNKTITLSGEVASSSVIARSIQQGYSQFGYGYPTALSVNNCNIDWIGCGLTAKPRIGQTPDCLMVWNKGSAAWTTFWLFTNTVGDVRNNTWVTGTQPNDAVTVTYTIEPGVGFMIQRGSATPATVSQPKPF